MVRRTDSGSSARRIQAEGQVAISNTDFQRWWRTERVGALLMACPTTPWATPGEVPVESELALLRRVKPSHREPMLLSVYEGSRRLGQVLSKRLGRPLSSVELTEILGHTDVPCLVGRWASDDGAREWRLERPGCAVKPAAIVCDYWHAAIRGLIAGMDHTTRLEEVENRGHGGGACVDLICSDGSR